MIKTPMNKRKIIVAALLVAVAVVLIGVSRSLQSRGAFVPPAAEERKKGNPAAPIQVIEHMDYQCGACAYGASLLKEYMKKYPDKIYLEAHFYPLAGHPHGATSARYAYCAQQEGRFWAYHERLFETQAQWHKLADAKPFFKQLADEVGINSDRVVACAEKPETLDMVNAIRKSAEAKGVTSTPAFFVNGKMVVGTTAFVREMNALLPNEKQASAEPN